MLQEPMMEKLTAMRLQGMLDALKALFETHAADGRVRFDYVAVMYAGRLVG